MKRKIIYLLLIFASVFSFGFSNLSTFAFAKNNESLSLNLSAKSAILVDFDSSKIIYEKNAHERLPIASMTKLASLAIVFDAIEKGIIKLGDEVVVSKNAASVGGSSAFLDAGSRYKLSDLIKTIIISSANDSCVAVAEFMTGSEQAFVGRMNKLAEKLNLENTNFENCTGLPAKNHYSSAFDMVKIYKEVCDNETYLKYSKIWMDELMHPSGRKTELVNTNRLVKTYDGIESGKTGYTDSAKFCLTASAKRNNMRLIGVVIGVGDSKTRFAEMSKLFDFGFANYKSIEIIDSSIPTTINKVKNAKNMVEIYPSTSISKLLDKNEESKYTTDYQLFELKAPIKAGDIVGKIFVFDENNMVVDETTLIAKNDVEKIDLSYSIDKIIKIW